MNDYNLLQQYVVLVVETEEAVLDQIDALVLQPGLEVTVRLVGQCMDAYSVCPTYAVIFYTQMLMSVLATLTTVSRCVSTLMEDIAVLATQDTHSTVMEELVEVSQLVCVIDSFHVPI